MTVTCTCFQILAVQPIFVNNGCSCKDPNHAKRERWKAERRWRLLKLDSDLVAFKIKHNTVNNVMKNARRAFYTNFIEENSCDQRTLFCASKRLFNQSQDDGLPPNLHAPTFANQIGEYFVTKIDTIQRQIEA